ncbi:uncharacterized protein PG986_011511 [Apiospora aurea]|uniref:O-methyltransferase n=1 Tax=Apiospora aurea TaxID=335848 RepID=A0ABR1PXE6_9PEZI
MAAPETSKIDEALSSIQAAPATLALLRRLHTQALTEPAYVSTDDTHTASAALDRFVALEPDKCALVYLLLRASGARWIVEAGTSFGVSTIYQALAVRQNAHALAAGGEEGGEGQGKVIATENEQAKADRARGHWAQTGEEDRVGEWIDLRVGDIRETLKTDLPERVDFLLLDIWAYLALPALRLVKLKMRIGATVVADNVVAAQEKYGDLLAYLDDPANGFKRSTAPYPGGLLVAVYVGSSG